MVGKVIPFVEPVLTKFVIVPKVPMPLVMPFTLAVASVPAGPKTNVPVLLAFPLIPLVPAIRVPLTVKTTVPEAGILIPAVDPDISRVTLLFTVTWNLPPEISPAPVQMALLLNWMVVACAVPPDAKPELPLLLVRLPYKYRLSAAFK